MVPLDTNFLQNIFHCVQQNKYIHTGLELLEDENIMTVFSFFSLTRLSVRGKLFIQRATVTPTIPSILYARLVRSDSPYIESCLRREIERECTRLW